MYGFVWYNGYVWFVRFIWFVWLCMVMYGLYGYVWFVWFEWLCMVCMFMYGMSFMFILVIGIMMLKIICQLLEIKLLAFKFK